MAIHLKTITAAKILALIQQFLSEADQQWLNKQLSHLSQRPPLSLTQKQNLVDQLCGSWADDNSIPPIFIEIEQQRALNKPREVSF